MNTTLVVLRIWNNDSKSTRQAEVQTSLKDICQ